jgi:hypothetical protein
MTLPTPAPMFPLRPISDGRYREDQADRPFLYHADTAWMLTLKLTPDEAEEYLQTRHAQDFNTI